MSQNPLHEKLKKLLRLAQEGIGGEAVNAQERLSALMKKHGVSIEQLTMEETEIVYFKPDKSDFGKKLLFQTIGAVGGVERYTYTNKYYPGKIGVYLTPAEKIEVELRYDAYVRALKEEFSVCYSAFVQKNRIFHKEAPTADPSEYSEEYIKRVSLAMLGMNSVTVRTALVESTAS